MTQNQVSNTPGTVVDMFECDGQLLRQLTRAGLIWLERHRDKVNALNVFPVPDGDTGTNMLLTMRSAYRRIEPLSDERHVGKMAQEVAQGALMGARGNSGVILSQVWRGIARALKDKATFDTQDLAVALQEATDTAYKGVMRPVEGTILTVIREGAEEASAAASESPDLAYVLGRILDRCRQTLLRTPELLPVLKQAGVVDSGGQGLVYVLEGMWRLTRGEFFESAEFPVTPPQEVAPDLAERPAQALARPEGGLLEFPYDVQFILLGRDLNVLEVRRHIDAMGDSTVVAGDEQMIKVHVHVKDPGVPISYAISLGHVTDVVVENMQMQMEQIIEHGPVKNVASEAIAPSSPTISLMPQQIGVVAVAAGDGLARVFHSLGVAQIVSGGQTNNPSTEEILNAIHSLPTENVIVLPNNKNITLAAESARDLSYKDVVVIDTRTIPQGVAVMLAYDPDGDLDEVAAAMSKAAGDVVSAEITRATRTVTLNGVNVAEGQLIGLVNGALCAAAQDMRELVAATLSHMNLEEREIVTFYYGRDVSAREAELMTAYVGELYPDLEIELHSGGQAHYYYFIGAE